MGTLLAKSARVERRSVNAPSNFFWMAPQVCHRPRFLCGAALMT